MHGYNAEDMLDELDDVKKQFLEGREQEMIAQGKGRPLMNKGQPAA